MSADAPPSRGMREALQWLMLARLCLLYLALTSIVLQQLFRKDITTSPQMIFGYALLSASFAFNLAMSLGLPRLPSQWWVASLHLAFDASATACWMALVGGREALFAMIYLIQILVVALTLYQRGALVAAVLSSLCFGVILFSSGMVSFLVWGLYSAVFLTVGVVGGFLSEELLRTTKRLHEKSRRIEVLTALHERILANLPTGLLTVDEGMRINFINPAGANILGRPAEQMIGKQLSDVEPGLLPYFEKLGEPRLQQRIELGRGSNRRVLRGDAAVFHTEGGIGNLWGTEASGGQILLFQDVTKLVQLEEKLRQHQKLAAVGQLAAGIAHEIRNPLASMSASIEMLKSSYPTGEEHSENHRLMDIAIREIDRLNRLITEFLDFVKPENVRLNSVDLATSLGELCSTFKSTKEFKNGLVLKLDLRPKVIAYGSDEKLKQVALNLLVNAVQAMTGPGTIEIGCASVNDQMVKFWVQDEGQGMTEEVKAHLYEPFFTTKDKGTGLGLATAYKIIEAHQGEIRVESTKGSGTKFEIYLKSA